MQTADISTEVQALLDTAKEAWEREVPIATKRQFSVSIIHLTVILRTIRSEAWNNCSPALLNFLLRMIPCALAVFNGTFATYSVNKELCRQTIVFLGSLFGVPRPAGLPRNAASALQNAFDAIPPCFFALASAGRQDDVRPLLNAIVLVAGGSAKQTTRKTWLHQHIAPHIFKSIEKEDPLITILRTILAGWISAAAGYNLKGWSTMDYVDIAEGVSVALTMRLENGHDTATKRLRSDMRAAARSLICSSKEARGRLIHFAFASGVLRAFESNSLDPDQKFKEALSRSFKAIIEHKMETLKAVANCKSITAFRPTDNETISMAFLVLRNAHPLKHVLTCEETQAFRSAIEAFMKSAAAVDKKHERKLDLLHRQLFWCVNSYSTMLGYAYTALSDQSNTSFLRELAVTHPSNATVSRFCAASVSKWQCSPIVAADLIDILSMVTESSSSIFDLCISHLVPIVSRESSAISTLAGLVIVLLEELNAPRLRTRIVFLLDFIRLCFSHRQKILDQSLQGLTSRAPKQKSGRKLWVEFATVLERALINHGHDETFCTLNIECLCQLIRCKDSEFEPAHIQLVMSLPSLLLEKYVFLGTQGSERKRLLQVVKVFDVIADKKMGDSMTTEFIKNVLESSKNVEDKQNRLIGVLLMRFLGRCDMDLFDIVSDGVSRFIGSDQQRKVRFLPLARLSVLGMDMMRKNKSVEWLLTFFQDISGTGKVTGSNSPEKVLARL